MSSDDIGTDEIKLKMTSSNYKISSAKLDYLKKYISTIQELSDRFKVKLTPFKDKGIVVIRGAKENVTQIRSYLEEVRLTLEEQVLVYEPVKNDASLNRCLSLWKKYCEGVLKVTSDFNIRDKPTFATVTCTVIGEKQSCAIASSLIPLQKEQDDEWNLKSISDDTNIIKYSMPIPSDEMMSIIREENFKNIIFKEEELPSILMHCTRADRKIRIIYGDIANVHTIETSNSCIICPISHKMEALYGVAGHLIRQGGQTIQQECTQWVKNNGPLQEGTFVRVAAGNLKANCIMFVNVINWSEGLRREKVRLQELYQNLFVEANRRSLTHVVTPLLCSGYSNFPLIEAMNCLAVSLAKFLSEYDTHSSLRTIDVVLNEKEKLRSLVLSLKDTLCLVEGCNVTVSMNTSKPEQRFVTYSWEWQDGQSTKSYDGKTSCSIEEAYTKGGKYFNFLIGGSKYMIDFSRMQQINEKTKFARAIKRVATEVRPTKKVIMIGMKKDVNAYTEQILRLIRTKYSLM